MSESDSEAMTYDDQFRGAGANITFSGNWVQNNTAPYYDNTSSVTTSPGAFVDLIFTGSATNAQGSAVHGDGRFYCRLVDLPEEPWQWYNASINSTVINYDVSHCSVTGLDNTTSHAPRRPARRRLGATDREPALVCKAPAY